MRSIIVLAVLLALIVPSVAPSPLEQAYMDGVNQGLKLGQLINKADQYNTAIQQFNDNLNQTFGGNASKMWLPKLATTNNDTLAQILATGGLKPVHKMDGTPAETTVIQY